MVWEAGLLYDWDVSWSELGGREGGDEEVAHEM